MCLRLSAAGAAPGLDTNTNSRSYLSPPAERQEWPCLEQPRAVKRPVQKHSWCQGPLHFTHSGRQAAQVQARHPLHRRLIQRPLQGAALSTRRRLKRNWRSPNRRRAHSRARWPPTLKLKRRVRLSTGTSSLSWSKRRRQGCTWRCSR